jgi:hypothetical protein
MVENIQDPVRKSSFAEYIADGPEALWREFRAFKNGSVTCSNGNYNRSRSEDVGGVPESQLILLFTWLVGSGD